ncbi:N-acetylmuramoyl-L-alanine amidase [Chlorobaculum sp. MV4-Y]|uniref:N-acetylmuramoyl-L-alanine amidase family protein n=1 Tax=Chlorobaculum sp. MV4-Y TaxID=2976335 RepID=UPI0021AF9155|nr:N-acetylmuramoyl-L-alanine amidase [Chlorobaculum sp. MV4-Y]UWX57690.1 N-acetylmuramoyl-L-alanine amidase [Chlorobaculum sp. MV4-Y]
MKDSLSRQCIRPLSLLLFFVLFASRLLAETSGQEAVFLQVTNGPEQGYTIKVQGSTQADGVFLADIGSFTRALRLGSVFDGKQMQIDEAFGDTVTSCILMEGSNFAVIASAAGDTPKRVLQLASAPVIRRDKVYLPVDQACRMFTLWLGRQVRYNASENKIDATLGSRWPDASLQSVGRLPDDAQPKPTELTTPSSDDRTDTGSAGEKTLIDGIKIETRANGAVIRFSASGAMRNASFLRPDKSGTLYLTIENAAGSPARLARNYPEGVVKSISPKLLDNGAMQFTIALNIPTSSIKSSSFRYDARKNDYVISIMNDVDVEAIHLSEKERRIQEGLSRDVDKWKLDAVVIDAGHGGKDPGAIGTQGTREKDVVLNIARDLGMFIRQKWPDVKVIYTRKEDRFIPLKERGQIANRYGGKIFVSIHCNSSANNSKVRGPEVYILGPHKTDAALKVAMFENSVITGEENSAEKYKGFSDEYLIMSSMAQSAFATQSTELAQDVLQRLSRDGSNTRLGVRQAGFMVLWTPSMPSILVETGYLSNPSEEKLLRDRKEQTKIAYAIFQGLQQYRSRYETRMTTAARPVN